MVYDADPNRAAAVDDVLRYYLKEEFGDLPDYHMPMRKNNTSGNLIIPQLLPAITSITFHVSAWHILTGLCALVMTVICPIFPSTYFQLTFSINISYVRRVQQHLQLRLCGDVYSISEGTYIGLDSRAEISILSIVYNAPRFPIEQSVEKFE